MAGAPMGGTSGNAMSQGAPGQMQGDMLMRGLQPRQLSPAEQAFQAAHPMSASTTYAPGYQQNWMNNWGAQQAQPQNQLGGGLLFPPGGIQQEAIPGGGVRRGELGGGLLQNTGQQITDPETGRNFTIGAPMTMDMNTGLAYKRAMEAFNQSNQQLGGQAQQPQMPSGTGFQAPQGQQTNPNIMQSSANWINQAAQGTQAGMNYMPERVGFGGYTPFVGVGGSVPNVSAGGPTERIGDTGQQQRISAGQIGQTDLQQYINPYTQQVIDTSMADLERQRQMQQNELGAQASRAGAFGGSRQGVAEALTNEAFARTGAQTAANLRQQGFQQAQQAAGQDIGYRLQADLANQSVSGADLARQLQANLANQGVSAGDLARQLQAGMANQSAAGQNIGFGMQASLANQAARQADLQRMLQANQFNATTGMTGAQQRLNAAQQLAGIAGQGFDMGQQLTQGLSAQGAMQQALQQALIDAARGQYSGFMGAPAQSLGYMGSALGASPTPQTTTATRQPGVFDYLTAGAMFAPRFR